MDELDELTIAFLETHPREAARELERLPLTNVAAVLASAPARVVAPILAAIQSRTGAAALLPLGSERAALLLRHLSSTSVAAILRHASAAQRAVLLDALPVASALACRALLRYPEDAVGAYAETQVLTLHEQSTSAQALDALRAEHDGCDGVFVVTDEHRLVGWVAAGRLLRCAPTLRLSALVLPIVRLPALMPVSSAIEAPVFAAVPRVAVVEQGERLLGEVTLAALRYALSARSVAVPLEPGTTALGLLATGYWQAVAGLAQASISLLVTNTPPRR